MIERGAAGDRQQPVDQRSCAIEGAEVLIGFQESLLGEVFGVLAVTDHVAEVIKNSPVIRLHELVEGWGVACCRRAYQGRLSPTKLRFIGRGQ